VLVTVSDKKIGVDANADGVIDYYNADVISAQDYFPFGQVMPGRQYGNKGRYLFNGKEQDAEVKGAGNQYDYGFRIYDPRLGRFLSVDPLTPSYPHYTPYQFAGNNPIKFIDLDGLEEADPAANLYKTRPTLDMNGAPANSPTNAQGFFRNKNYFWGEYLSQNLKGVSDNNRALINSGYSPWVDQIWIDAFPEDAIYRDNRLIHHHIEGKNMAVAIPEKLHWDKYSDLHAYLKNNLKSTLKGTTFKGLLGNTLNVVGTVSLFNINDPDSWINAFSGGNPEDAVAKVTKDWDSNTYLEIDKVVITTLTTTNTKTKETKSRIIQRIVTGTRYNSYIKDEETGKYRGIDKIETTTETWNYDEKGNRQISGGGSNNLL